MGHLKDQSAANTSSSTSLLPANPTRTTDPATKKTCTKLQNAYTIASWMLEMSAAALCVSCSIAIAIVLAVWSDHPVPQLSKGITVNAIVSILATMSKSAMLLVVASCMSQQKWIWFRSRRPLAHIQLFEDASRGPLGSVSLLMNHTVRSTAALGAIITILALAFDPFAQQVLLFPLKGMTVESPVSIMKQAFASPIFDWGLESAVSMLLGVNTQQTPACEAANCTWNSFSSVGWCSRCEPRPLAIPRSCTAITDIDDFSPYVDSDSLGFQRSCDITIDGNHTFALPLITFRRLPDCDDQETTLAGFAAWSLTQTASTGLGEPVTIPLTLLDVHDPILAMSFAHFELNQDGQVTSNSSQVCILDLCLQDYAVSVESGEANVKQTAFSHGKKFTKIMADESDSQILYDCWSGTDDISSLDLRPSDLGYNDSTGHGWIDEEHFVFCQDNLFAGSNMQLTRVLVGNQTTHWGPAYLQSYDLCKRMSDDDRSYSDDDQYSYIWESPPYSEELNQIITLGPEVALQNLASALTKAGLSNSVRNVSGKAIFMVAHVEVRWLWLILPASLNMAGVVLLVITIVFTKKSKAPLWKASATALLFHGLDFELGDTGPSEKLRDMDREARSMRVQLVNSQKRGRLLLQT